MNGFLRVNLPFCDLNCIKWNGFVDLKITPDHRSAVNFISKSVVCPSLSLWVLNELLIIDLWSALVSVDMSLGVLLRYYLLLIKLSCRLSCH